MSDTQWTLFWTAFGAIGSTVGSLATALAVIVALWQTKVAYKKELKIVFIDAAFAPVGDETVPIVSLQFANTGNRSIIINSVMWQIKSSQNEYVSFFLIPAKMEFYTCTFPYELLPEYKQSFVLRRAAFVDSLLEMTKENPKLKKQKLRFVIEDSVGKKYVLKTKKTPSYYISRRTEVNSNAN